MPFRTGYYVSSNNSFPLADVYTDGTDPTIRPIHSDDSAIRIRDNATRYPTDEHAISGDPNRYKSGVPGSSSYEFWHSRRGDCHPYGSREWDRPRCKGARIVNPACTCMKHIYLTPSRFMNDRDIQPYFVYATCLSL